MPSAAQLQANRANAQLSTGPATSEGLERTRHNATKHGLTGKQIVIKGEDPAEYDALRHNLVEQYAPANEREAMLVEEIAQNWWRLQRARRVETQIITTFDELAIILDPEAAKAYRTISRYLNTIQRAWKSACDSLEKLQAERRKQAAQDAPARQPENGSVSSPFPSIDANDILRAYAELRKPFRK